MDGRQIQALLGQWYDITVGRGGGMRSSMGPGMGPGMRHHHRHHRWWDQQQQGDGYGYGDYGADQGGADVAAAWMAYAQQLAAQLAAAQQPQIPMPPPGGAPAPGGAPGGAPGPGVSGWYDIVGQSLPSPADMWPPPRAAVVDAPLPTQANRDILPMSTGVPILPTQSAQITGRPQTLVFKIGRFVISNAGTAGGSADWIVNDIKIGNRSQFVQSGDVPGDLFATNAIDTFVRFESAQTAMDVVVVVTYIGLNESGCPFFGAMVGTAAV